MQSSRLVVGTLMKFSFVDLLKSKLVSQALRKVKDVTPNWTVRSVPLLEGQSRRRVLFGRAIVVVEVGVLVVLVAEVVDEAPEFCGDEGGEEEEFEENPSRRVV